jgi:hypothetical protein
MTKLELYECKKCGYICVHKTVPKRELYYCAHCNRRTMRTIDSIIGLRTADGGYERNTITNVIGRDKKGRLRLGTERAMSMSKSK